MNIWILKLIEIEITNQVKLKSIKKYIKKKQGYYPLNLPKAQAPLILYWQQLCSKLWVIYLSWRNKTHKKK